MASESSTGIPSRANSLPVSVLPMPMEPVRPTRKTRAFADSGNAKRFQKKGAKGKGHGRTYPEPCRKGRYRLMHQHAETIHGLVPGGFGLPQQRRSNRLV